MTMVERNYAAEAGATQGERQREVARSRIRQAMKKANVSQQDIAARLVPPVHRNTVCRWLGEGADLPDFLQFMQIAEMVKEPVEWLSGKALARMPKDEIELLGAYRGHGQEGRRALLSMAIESLEMQRKRAKARMGDSDDDEG